MHLVNARLDDPETFVGFDDGDRVILIRRDGIRSRDEVFVSDAKIVEGGRVGWDREEIALPLFERFGWAIIGEDPDPPIIAHSYRDEFEVAARTSYVILAMGVEP